MMKGLSLDDDVDVIHRKTPEKGNRLMTSSSAEGKGIGSSGNWMDTEASDFIIQCPMV